jgi:putative transposase
VIRLCGYFGFTRQAYYKQAQMSMDTALKDELVIKLVQEQRTINKNLGTKKVYNKQRESIHQINSSLGRDKLFDLLRRHGLLIKRRRKYAVTTQSNHRYKKYENKMKDFTPSAPHQAWVGDITYLRTTQGFVYLFLLTDAFSRKIVGWEVNKSLGVKSALKAARMALKQCPNTKQLIHHTDRGFQYCSPRYAPKMKKKGLQMSMGEAGNCYDNAMAERVNGILKGEYGLDATFKNIEEALKATKESIKDYNEERPHWGLKLKIPSMVHAG